MMKEKPVMIMKRTRKEACISMMQLKMIISMRKPVTTMKKRIPDISRTRQKTVMIMMRIF
ncbi:MAG: hypothetical protein U5K32_04175 [Bacteroidales bacterium]|nr:hypothetical protein [Bacteroidales bacterium]